MSFLFSNPLEEPVARATSENLPIGTDDIALNLEIADTIKGKSVSAKTAVQTIKKRINNKNPNVQLLALKLTDTCVKNSGHHFVQEVASREFIDNIVSLAKAHGTNPEVRTTILSLIQSWALAFRTTADLSYVPTIYDSLKREGLTFPPPPQTPLSTHMFTTTTPPEWTDSDLCMRCRTTFTTFNRKHHCRNCGQTFCNACSSKTIALPHLGIVDSVRVCDGCHSKLSNPSTGQKKDDGFGSRTTSTSHLNSGTTTTNREDDLARKEREELEKAIAASLETSKKATPSLSSYSAPVYKPEPKPQPKRQDNDEDDEDLRKAIEASLKDLNVSDYTSSTSQSSASAYPVAGGYSSGYGGGRQEERREERRETVVSTPSVNVNELSSVELDNIRMFSELVERTEADVAGRGLGGLNATGLQAMYAQIATTQPKLASMMDDTSAKYRTFLEMHDKLAEAVRIYDRMLEERLRSAGASSGASAYASGSYAGTGGYGYQHQQQQQQQGYEGYGSQPPAPPQGYEGYAPPPPQQQHSYGTPGAGYGGEGYYAGGHPPPPPSSASEGGDPHQQPPASQQPQQYGYEYATSPPQHAAAVPPAHQSPQQQPQQQGQEGGNYTYSQPPSHSFAPGYGSPQQGGYALPQQQGQGGYAPQQQGYEGYGGGYYQQGGAPQQQPQQQAPQPVKEEAPLIEL
ncbi:Vacuolar protein-sorting-associated protein 27 [Rhizophlyctis rosea]|uniref:Vacuolar protein sorting-associated protein 27 n=1 Tax=Rhizophlyctis rosea TaxID=64517 RepID=A0AAD5SKY5_9FUNG|nr:Vacuolar protein-sorting-associated protein 27 [Rhizophlyctis rosea]